MIGMFYREHGVPHFHAVYGEHEISVEIETTRVHGDFPARALKLALGWTAEQPGQGPDGPGEQPASDPNAVSIFTALEEQLGLRLSSTWDTLEVVVVDTLEQPTPN